MANNLNFGDGVKGFFIKHGEKVALATCGIILALFFAMGSTIDALPDDKTPDHLASMIARANTLINSDTNNGLLLAERRPNTFDLIEDTGKTDSKAYPPIPGIFAIEDVNKKALRDDPALFPPNQPIATVIVSAIAVKSARSEDPLKDFKPATVEPKKKKDDNKRRPRGRRGDPDDEEFQLPEMDDVDFGAAENAYKVFPPSLHLLLKGAPAPAEAVANSANIVCIVTTVDYETQLREFEKTLSNALNYDPTVDRPTYLKFDAQVLDVTSDPEMVVDLAKGMPEDERDRINQMWSASSEKAFASKWGRTWDSKTVTLEDISKDQKTYLIADTVWQSILASRWYGGPVAEVADPRYTHPNLSSAIPPFLMTDYENSVLHPDIPTLAALIEELKKEGPATGLDWTDRDLIPDGENADMRNGGVVMPRGGRGFDDEPGDMLPGAMLPGVMGGGEQTAEVLVPKKLVRFFHLGAKPGRKYRYRVRVVLVDPNNPNEGSSSADNAQGNNDAGVRLPVVPGAKPNARLLSDELMASTVRARLRQVRDADEKYAAKIGEAHKTYWRFSEWSVASAAVEVPVIANRYFAGAASKARATKIGGKEKLWFVKGEPSGKIVTSVWSSKYAVHIPAEQDVNLGSMLNFNKDADVLHPVNLSVLRIPEFNFRTEVMVVDIQGGEILPSNNKEDPLLSPGELLLVDGNGNLFAQHELDDMDDYRWSLLIDDTPKVDENAMDEEDDENADDANLDFLPGEKRGRRRRNRDDDA
ncbi:MAG: hypothetical protein IH991_14020 [Planctomycetes bacterium]|nr:hypothetical protein [Planctomycetota bacterium]